METMSSANESLTTMELAASPEPVALPWSPVESALLRSASVLIFQAPLAKAAASFCCSPAAASAPAAASPEDAAPSFPEPASLDEEPLAAPDSAPPAAPAEPDSAPDALAPAEEDSPSPDSAPPWAVLPSSETLAATWAEKLETASISAASACEEGESI